MPRGDESSFGARGKTHSHSLEIRTDFVRVTRWLADGFSTSFKKSSTLKVFPTISTFQKRRVVFSSIIRHFSFDDDLRPFLYKITILLNYKRNNETKRNETTNKQTDLIISTQYYYFNSHHNNRQQQHTTP